MSRRTLALVFGGASSEHDVSLISGRAIYEQLDREAYDPLLVGIDRQGRPFLGSEQLFDGGLERGEGLPLRWPAHPGERCLRHAVAGDAISDDIDVVFPIIHGKGGEDGGLQGLCALAGIPCVGAGVLASALAMDKDRARRLFVAEGLPVVPDFVLRERLGSAELAELIAPLGWPLFVKPARAGSSIGISRVEALDELDEALERAREVDDKVILEQAVLQPREIEMAVLGHDDLEVAGPGEIIPHGVFYDYRAKYEDPESELLIPAPVSKEMAWELASMARQACLALDLRGMARVDFLLSGEDGRIVLNEINTLPGFTPISMYPKLWEAAGLGFSALIDRLIELARVP